jgi:hypothetical protein
MMRAPRWSHEDAVFEVIKRELELEWELEQERQSVEYYATQAPVWVFGGDGTILDMHYPDGTDCPRLSPEDLRNITIEAAVQAAREGDFRPLRKLTDDVQIRNYLPAEAWRFINDRLDGKKIGKPGPRKKSSRERYALNPIHNAARLFPQIKELLHENYPKQDKKAVRDRALAFAARLADMRGLGSAHRLALYMASGKKDRRRLK